MKNENQSKMCKLLLFKNPVQLSIEKDERKRKESFQELINMSPEHITFKSISELARFMATIKNAMSANSAWNIATRKIQGEIDDYLKNGNTEFSVRKFSYKKYNSEEISYQVAGYGYYIILSNCELFELKEETEIQNVEKVERSKKHIVAIERDLDNHTVDGKKINYYRVRKELREAYPDVFLWKIAIPALKNMKRHMPKQIDESVLTCDGKARILNNVRYYEVNHKEKKYKWYDVDSFFEKMNIDAKERTRFFRVMAYHTTPHGETYMVVNEKNAKVDRLFIEETQLYAICVNWNETFRNMVCGKILPSINETGSFDVQQLKQEEGNTNVVPVDPVITNTLPDIAESSMISAEIINQQMGKVTTIINRYHDYHGCLTQVDMDYLRMTKPAFCDIVSDTVKTAKGLKLRKCEDVINVCEEYKKMINVSLDLDDDNFDRLLNIIMSYTCIGSLNLDGHMSIVDKMNLINDKTSSFSVQSKKLIWSRQAIWNDVIRKFEKNGMTV